MKRSKWNKIDDIVTVAIDMAPDECDAFIRRACDGDAELLDSVCQMIGSVREAASEDYLGQSAFGDAVRSIASAEDADYDSIGSYDIVRELGRGGMGRVFLAEHKRFHHRVAIKVIKRGMDTDEIVRQFERERDVLAGLDHPFIAKLVDGGTTPDGLPYLVMEYVKGVPVTEHCDKNKLNIEERLSMFRKICEAVAYAHQNLVVHRDIKPSNILIDSHGQPKLLDFGIAKLLRADAADSITNTGMFMMTPDYAAPEQIKGEKVTTASDIYSLGVVLYELLCGHHPYRLKDRSQPEMLRIISEREPSAPSTAALTTEEIVTEHDTVQVISPDTIADLRSEKPHRLRRRLDGDIDNIVLKSLFKEPDRRYHTVEQFADDIRRHLEGLPVMARPATLGYRVSRFVDRNRIAVGFATAALVAIIAGLTVSLWQTSVARAEHAAAERRFNDVRQLANRLITDLDAQVKKLPNSHHLSVELARASSEYLNKLALESDEPDLQVELATAYLRVGDIFGWEMENTSEAETSLMHAISFARKAAEAEPDNLQARDVLAQALEKYNEYFSARDYPSALSKAIERASLREEILTAKPDQVTAYSQLYDAYWACADISMHLGDRPGAERHYRSALDVRDREIERFADRSDPMTRISIAYAWLSLGDLKVNSLNDRTGGKNDLRRAADIARAVYKGSPESNTAVMAYVQTELDLADVLKGDQEFEEALDAYGKVLEAADAVSTPGTWLVDRQISTMVGKAICEYRLGNKKDAVADLNGALELRRDLNKSAKTAPRALSAEIDTWYAVARAFALMERFDDAAALYRSIEANWKRVTADETDADSHSSEIGTFYVSYGDLYAGCSPDLMLRNCPAEGLENSRSIPKDRLVAAIEQYKKAKAAYSAAQTGMDTVAVRTVDQKLAILHVKPAS